MTEQRVIVFVQCEKYEEENLLNILNNVPEPNPYFFFVMNKEINTLTVEQVKEALTYIEEGV